MKGVRDSGLETINISMNKLGPGIGPALGTMLSRDARLKKLIAKGINLSFDDWKPIADGLAKNRTLRVLILTRNKAVEDIVEIFTFFAFSMKRLTRLGIASEREPTHFHNDEAALRLLSALEHNYSLVDIDGCSQNSSVRAILDRNLQGRKRVMHAVILLLAARRHDFGCLLAQLPAHVVESIARALHETRGEREWVV